MAKSPRDPEREARWQKEREELERMLESRLAKQEAERQRSDRRRRLLRRVGLGSRCVGAGGCLGNDPFRGACSLRLPPLPPALVGAAWQRLPALRLRHHGHA